MTVGQFAEAAELLRRATGASEDSGGRTDAYEASLPGGIKNGPHPWGLARDWVYGTHDAKLPNRPGSEGHLRTPHSCPSCSTPLLKLIHEGSHDHVQPADFPAGSVSRYDGEEKTWA